MIRRTIHIGSPARLYAENRQLCIERKDDPGPVPRVPVEDIGCLVLEHPQISLTNTLMALLMEAQASVLFCGQTYMPAGMALPIEGHHLLSERSRQQTEASLPLRKQLWAQTVSAKIHAQAAHLAHWSLPAASLLEMAGEVRSGDPLNLEARAAAYYWRHLFGEHAFRRDPQGSPPNHLLNYAYAILRAVIARAIAAAGLLPVLGLHHRNQYNAFCLADDLMEPYRPFADLLVRSLWAEDPAYIASETLLPVALKKRLLQLPAMDVALEGERCPLAHAAQRTAVSLTHCFGGESRKLLYPRFCV